jgi:hypothetical protein
MRWVGEGGRGESGPKEARVLVDCLAGSSLPSVIAANAESAAVAAAISGSPAAQATLFPRQEEEGGGGGGGARHAAASAALAALRAHAEPDVAAAVEAWWQWLGYRLIDGHTGFATPPTLQEVPVVMLGLLRHCVREHTRECVRSSGGRRTAT